MADFNLSGSWEGPLGAMMTVQQSGTMVSATPANPACSQHWTSGNGTLSGATLDMNFQGGPAAGNYRGSVATNGNAIGWNNGYHWVRLS